MQLCFVPFFIGTENASVGQSAGSASSGVSYCQSEVGVLSLCGHLYFLLSPKPFLSLQEAENTPKKHLILSMKVKIEDYCAGMGCNVIV